MNNAEIRRLYVIFESEHLALRIKKISLKKIEFFEESVKIEPKI